MKRTFLAGLMVLLLLTSGCQTRRPDVVRLARNTAPDSVVKGTFWVNSSADSILLQAAQDFCQRVSTFSGKSVELTVEQETDQKTFRQSPGSFYYVNDVEQGDFSGYSNFFDTPFLFTGYNHYAISVNSPLTLAMVGESMSQLHKARPLTALYQGQEALVSRVSLTAPESFARLPIVLEEDMGIVAAYTRLGAEVESADSQSDRLSMLENAEVKAAAVDLAKIQYYRPPRDFVLALTSHRISFLWLVADEQWMETLSAAQKAAVKEATAYILRQVDDHYLTQEAQITKLLDERGVLIQSDLQKVRKQSIRLGGTQWPSPQERELWQLTQELAAQ
ncbi:hypothetical protein U6B65_01585 [Oscillospiraceae bacterium MB08-C2-2]|nr:hypothetical protein U6B65_01585 [Oscillospiraceae bacterium MB08-C2-2]